jgi:hypothetical protein
MTDWLKGCEVCNAGLCQRFDELLESGEGYREAAKTLEDEQKNTLGEVVYSYSSLLSRYYRNKPEVFRNETVQQSEEEWPKCSLCGRRKVEKNYRTGKPIMNGKHGLCAQCKKDIARSTKYKEGQRKLDQTPIDPESNEYWKDKVEKLNELFGRFKSAPCGKIEKETLDALNDIRRHIDFFNNRLNEQHIFVIK